MRNGDNGKTNIYFGTVVSVDDADKKLRIQVPIINYTDELPQEDLPWYYPNYGIYNLPEVGEVVAVIIYDNDFTTGMYTHVLKPDQQDHIDDNDYVHYLELFRRVINDKQVELKYTLTNGIEFINDTSKQQLEVDKTTIFVESNYIRIGADYIHIGDKNREPTPLGNKTIKQLEDMLKHQQNTIDAMMEMFNAIKTAASNPYTKPINIALTPLIPKNKSSLNSENKSVTKTVPEIVSKKVFIE